MLRSAILAILIVIFLAGCTAPSSNAPSPRSDRQADSASAAPLFEPLSEPLRVLAPLQPSFDCEYEIAPAFRPWRAFGLGCPLGKEHVDPVAINEFGDVDEADRLMLWSARDRTIYALFPRGTWESFPDTWSDAEPTFSCNPLEGIPKSPPLPKRGFGKVWCNDPDVRSQMGFIQSPERLCEEAIVQDFVRGSLIACIEPKEVRYIHLLADGTWQMSIEPRSRNRAPLTIESTTSYVLELLDAIACLTAAEPQDTGGRPNTVWEPKGLHIVDLVGLVPEEQLQNTIIVWSGEGTVHYLSGERDGDAVTVNARVFTKELAGVSFANCLGQWAHFDQWAVAMPAGRVRLYADGVEITERVSSIEYYPANQAQPDHGTERNRYRRTPQESPTFNASGALELSANTGCVIAIPGDYPELTAEFSFDHPPQIHITSLGEQEFVFQTYIGVGEAGALDSLRNQLMDRFGERHDKFTLSPPPGTDTILVRFPDTPVSAYGNGPLTNPSSGTYRLAEGDSILSTDHLVTTGLPLHAQWRDADQSRTAPFLPAIGPIDTLTTPEYFVPPGIDYDPCMTKGPCPDELLDAIHAAEMALTVFYYRISRVDATLRPFPLRMAGPRYDADAGNWSALTPADGHVCGWFDVNGRMLDYSRPSIRDADGAATTADP